MSMQNDPQHKQVRDILRIVGPALVILGVLCLVSGLNGFFSPYPGPFSSFRYFFFGLPLIGVGSAICRFAFMGAVSRYMANEVVPVGKDVVNYIADETKGAVRDLSAAFGDGLRSGMPSHELNAVRCQKCDTNNDVVANFCKSCGTPLTKTKPCARCGSLNDADARFCDNCGVKKY
jgi:ribosomal protein L40E